jgi:hypothetical protein
MKHLKKFDTSEIINEANSVVFKYRNEPNPIIDKAKIWIESNPGIARRKPEESDFFDIDVFGYNNKKVADDLYQALKNSGFLQTYPLFSIRIEPMQ